MKILLPHYKREVVRLWSLLLFPILLPVLIPKFFGIVSLVVFMFFAGLAYYENYKWYEIIAGGLGGVLASIAGLVIILESIFAPMVLLSFVLRVLGITTLVMMGRSYSKANSWVKLLEELP